MTPKTYGLLSRDSFESNPFPEYSRLFIQDQLAGAKFRKEELLYDIRNRRRELRFSLPDSMFEGAMDRAGEVAYVRGVAHLNDISHKIENLCSNSKWEQFTNVNNVVVIGDVNIDKYEKMLLSLGLGFSVDAFLASTILIIGILK